MLTTRIAGTTAAFIVIVGLAQSVTAQTTTTGPAPEPSSRPSFALTSLYGTFIALQGFDVDSTLRGIHSGRTQEANPFVGSMAESPAMFIAFKAGTTAGIIALCEQLRREHHGTAAMFVMIGLNSAYATVVAHNYQLQRR